ncbi:DUF2577 domain-containing protein [Clostridium botulinum]|uniref:DUF2577 domain-containing protein n=1 Tax=Clostridium botulinum TaxID=1491 RepID=UPI001E3EA121|nr:DUF2577 domain-containing protein [Clostridium botulinum]MCD3223934.1 DUF2577 domain-containing protein [Clostridium botulinum C/D]MCD3296283.1 DUF2577 domain-containing protein [Clostridium botulinum C/D]
MKKDPYVGIIGIMEEAGKKHNPPSIQLGQVINISPIKIKVGDLILEKYNLLINEDLLKHDRKVTINNYANINNATMHIETILNKNDTIAILPTQDRQIYIVLCKVV